MKDKALEANAVHAWGVGAPPMLLSHGFGCDQTVWNALLPIFAARQRVVAYDLTGAGQSDRPRYNEKTYGTLHGYADDVLRICHTMKLRNVVYVGHSVSAMIGVLAALREPELFSHLVLIAPSPCYENVGDYAGGFSRAQLDGTVAAIAADLPGFAGSAAPAFMGNPDRPQSAEGLRARFCGMDPAIAAHFARVVFMSDHREDIARVQTPTLILQCTDDVVAPLAVGTYMARKMPHNRLQVLRATGHFPHLCAPEETAGAVMQYLQQTGTAARARA